MKAKLTLSLDKAIIEKGRKIARKEHKSLSMLVEGLLDEEIKKDTMAKQKMIEKLHGMFRKDDVDTNWKDVIRDAASKKYGA